MSRLNAGRTLGSRHGRAIALAVTALMVATLAVFSAPAVTAHNSPDGYYGVNYSKPSGCLDGRLCVFSGTAFSGSYAQFAQDNLNWDCCPAAKNNDESAYNNGTTGNTVKVFELDNYGGWTLYCLRMGHGWKLLGSTLGAHHENNGQSNDWQWFGC